MWEQAQGSLLGVRNVYLYLGGGYLDIEIHTKIHQVLLKFVSVSIQCTQR